MHTEATCGRVFFASRRRHTRYWRDWSSDVCSSDLDLLRLSTPAGIAAYDLDAPIVGMGLWGGRVAIATQASLYTLGGYADPTAAKWTEIGRASGRERV